MSDWLKAADNGYLIGPDGCSYPNEHQAAHFGLLQLCGCGSPEDAYNFCRDVLMHFDRRGCHDRPPIKEWIDAEEAVKQLIVERPDQAAHVLSHLLTHLKLLEHGSSVGGSWLTKDGERIIDMGPATREKMDQE
jgi:hypothetical protein